MRVLHLLKTGIGASWAVRQASALRERGLDIHVALPDGPRVADVEASGLTAHIIDPGLPTGKLNLFAPRRKQLLALLEQVQPDLVHSHFVSTTLMLRLSLGRGHRLPRIFNVPGPLHLENAVTRRMELLTAGPSDSWIASCEWTRQRYLSSGISASRLSLAYYFADDLADVPLCGQFRAELGLEADVPLIGMVAFMYAPKRFLGQRTGLKGHEDLIDAMVLVRQRVPNAKVVLAGGAWAGAEKYELSVRNYGKKRLGADALFLGTRDDIPRLYADFDIAVHPSHSENLGGAAESLQAGVPTIATSVGGFPDLIINEVTGLLVPPRDPVRMSSAIIHMLENRHLAREMAAAGADRAARLLDQQTNIAAVLSAYDMAVMRSR